MHSASRNGTPAPSAADKGKGRATDVVHGAGTSTEVDAKTWIEPSLNTGASSQAAPEVRGSAAASSSEVDSKTSSQLSHAVQPTSSALKSEATTDASSAGVPPFVAAPAASNAPASEEGVSRHDSSDPSRKAEVPISSGAGPFVEPPAGTSSAQRESTPMGGSLWSDIEQYLQTREGPPPKVTCLFCTKELVIEGLQNASDGREATQVLPCGHTFGEKCMRQWEEQQTYVDELDGRVSASCPICRRSASSGRELPQQALSSNNMDTQQILGRRQRPDTSVSVSRPAQQRLRHHSPEDRIMQDADSPEQPGEVRTQRAQETSGQFRRERKEIMIKDPETRNDQGDFTESRALVLGKLAMRGKMAVELPSANPDFPAYPRRYMVKCTDYRIKWGSLRSLQKRDLARLKEIARRETDLEEGIDGYWVPEVVGVISSPQYTTEVQANPFHIVLLRLPGGDEWHSRSDAFAAFGDLTIDMEDYWLRSGQKGPMKPRATHQREYLQQLGAQQEGPGALSDLDAARATEQARLLQQTMMLDRERLAARRRPEPQVQAGAVGGDGVDLVEEEERGRSRTRRP